MRIATFLPHVGVFGGVRRFLELGNAWAAGGHDVTLFHSDGAPPSWLPYRGRVLPLTAAAEERSDVAFTADPHTWEAFLAHPSECHVYYCVLERDAGIANAIRTPHVRLAANSGPLRGSLERRAGRRVLDGIGGINTRQFQPAPALRAAAPLRVLVNGRRSRAKKGTDLILGALEGIRNTPEFEIVLFDALDPRNPQDPRDRAPMPPNARYVLNPTQDGLVGLYQSSHVFVAAERKAGWCNTALEAMACGAAVACTRSGTTDFARNGETAVVIPRLAFFVRSAVARLLRDDSLRARLSAAGPRAAAPWTWDVLATKLLDQLSG